MKLYELPAAFAAIETSDDGELTPEAMAALAALEMQLEQKLDGCCRVMRGFEARAAAYKTEADRLANHARVAFNNAARLRNYMDETLRTMGIDKIETELFKLRMQRNPPSVQVPDEVVGKLPIEFQKIKIEAAKLAILDAYKAGQPLPDGVTVRQTVSLRIS